MKNYFVMLNNQNGNYTPLINELDDYAICKFETYQEAYNAASKNLLGQMFGFNVFNIEEPCNE